jgi:hypothetical protein
MEPLDKKFSPQRRKERKGFLDKNSFFFLCAFAANDG